MTKLCRRMAGRKKKKRKEKREEGNPSATYVMHNSDVHIRHLFGRQWRGFICKELATQAIKISAFGIVGGLLSSGSLALERSRRLVILAVGR